MQLEGMTSLEARIVEAMRRVETELPAGELSTSLVVVLSDAVHELQRNRGAWPQV